MASMWLPNTDDDSKDNFIRLHLAVHYFCQEALPCLTDELTKWHRNEAQQLQPCRSPQQCATNKKPTTGRSCAACVAWGTTIHEVSYARPGKRDDKQITWKNVNPTRCHDDPIEVAKAFVLNRLVSEKTYSRLDDFDVANLLTLMMNFSTFHGNNSSVYDKIKDILAVRNDVSHMKIKDNFCVEAGEMGAIFQALDDLVIDLIILHPNYFKEDMREEIQKFKSYQVTPDLFARALLESEAKVQGLHEKCDVLSADLQNIKLHQNEQTAPTPKSDEFDVAVCRRELRTFYLQSLCKIPQFPGIKQHYLKMDVIFTNLAILINLPKPCAPIELPLNSRHEIFTSRDSDGVPPSRILVLGNPGCGKSVLTLKLTHDWATQNSNSPLKNVDLLFALNMRWMTPETTLEESIVQQLLPNDTKISKTSLRDYIERNQSSCVILFDSYDEYGFNGDFTKQESGVHGILLNTCLRECQVLVTSRFWKAGDFDDLRDVYTQMQISGYSDENVKEYVFKYFCHDKVTGDKLLSYLSDHNLNPGMANVPLMTLLFCLYWKDSGGQDMPIKIGNLYSAIFRLLQKQYIAKNIAESIDLLQLIKDAGRVALSGLWSSEDKLVFAFQDFVDASSEGTLTAGCKIGILSMERQTVGNITTLRDNNIEAILAESGDDMPTSFQQSKCISFFHKSVQEKCAGEYLADLYNTNPTRFATKMEFLDSAKTCSRLEMVLRFACGASSEVAQEILQQLMRNFRSEFSAQLQRYQQERLGHDDTKRFQKFIELCLQCYYECPDREVSHNLINELFRGQILFIGMSPYTSSAIGHYLISAKIITSLIIKAVPSPSDRGIIPTGLITNTESLIQNALKYISNKQLQQLLYQQQQREIKYPNWSKFGNLSRIELANCFKDWQSSYRVNLVPIFISLAYCDGLDTLELTNVTLDIQMTTLQDIINQGFLNALRTLRLLNNGLTDQQIDELLDSIPHHLPRLLRLKTSYNKARLARLGDCLVNSKIQRLIVNDMRAPAENMRDVISKLPQFGSRMITMYLDDDTAKALANVLPHAGHLHDFSISVDMIKRTTHKQVIQALHHLTHLRHLRIYDSSYHDDLLQYLSDIMGSLPHLHSLRLIMSQGIVQQSSKTTSVGCQPSLPSGNKLATADNPIQRVKRSACQRFIARLDKMVKMRHLIIGDICLHREDLISLLNLCHRHEYTFFKYSRALFPDDIDATRYPFLEFY